MQSLFVYITTPDADCARRLAETLVHERLAACANIIDGMEAFYRWQGAVENARESVCICKTTEHRYKALEERVRQIHPYDTPCIVALPTVNGFAPYLQWVADETRPDKE